MNPLQGHPYVLYSVTPDGSGALSIECHCRMCRDSWRYRCVYPAKAMLWVAKYGAKHAHGAPGVRDHFAHEYHTGLQQLRMAG